MIALTPLERRTARIGGKDYHWTREAATGRLTLLPGCSPDDPMSCPAPMCTLHRGHRSRHLYRAALGAAPSWFTTGDELIVTGEQ